MISPRSTPFTGREIWHYRHIARRALPQIPSNLGVTVADGRVFEPTDDAPCNRT
jgi:hypothetical protein